MGDGGERFLTNSAKAIVAQLNQQRSPEERASIAGALDASEHSGERAIAGLLRGLDEEAAAG